METFPAIIPDHPASKEVKVREEKVGQGDGREYVARFGLNPVDTTWRLTWTRLSASERNTIETFLEARAADGQPFEWTPPDEVAAQQFRVEQWAPARRTPTGWSLELAFLRVFETGEGIGAPEPTTCLVDADIPSDYFVTPPETDGDYIYVEAGGDAMFSDAGVLTSTSDPQITGLLGYIGWSKANLNSGALLYKSRLSEAGWSMYRDRDNLYRGGWQNSYRWGHCLYFNAFDGDLVNLHSITKHRLYRVRINPATGEILAANAWDRNLGATENPAITTSYSNKPTINAITHDDLAGDTYIASGLPRIQPGVAGTVSFGYSFLLKLNLSGTQSWCLRPLGTVFASLILIESTTILVIFGRQRIVRIRKSDGVVVGGPWVFSVTGSGTATINSVAKDASGNYYFSNELGNKTTGHHVIKTDPDLNVIWSKYLKLTADLTTRYWQSGAWKTIAWDSVRSRLVLTGTGQLSEFSDTWEPMAMAFDTDGNPIKSWRLQMNTGMSANFLLSPSRLYADSIQLYGFQSQRLTMPPSLARTGTARINGIGSTVSFGEVGLGSVSNGPVTTRAAGSALSIIADPGSAFVPVSTSISRTTPDPNNPATAVGTRLVF